LSRGLVLCLLGCHTIHANPIQRPTNDRILLRRGDKRSSELSIHRLRGGETAVAKLKQISEYGQPSHFKAQLPRMVDTCLAGLGLFGSLALLGAAETAFGVKLVVPPMMASGIIFFAGAHPPSPKGFLSGTVGCATVSATIYSMLSGRMSAPAAQGASAGALLVWYKLTGVLFPPAAVLSVLMVQAAAAAPAGSSSFSFVLFPWLAGHAGLYASALGVATLRQRVQLTISQARLQALGALPDEELKKIFGRFDTSKDGFLDPVEVKCALRVVTGVDVALADVERLVAAFDKNGDGVVNFREFKAIASRQVSAIN